MSATAQTLEAPAVASVVIPDAVPEGAPGLIADIGATNARFAMADANGFYAAKDLPCKDYPGIVEAAKAYLALLDLKTPPRVGSFAIAGPVKGDWFEMINHNWSFSTEAVRQELGLESLRLMNDFRAVALSIPHIPKECLRQIGQGEALKNAPIAIIGPGTGLGIAGLAWDEETERYVPVSGEGGHVTMPAQNQREFTILDYLHKKYTHVSAERVCSGKGLVNLYDAIRAVDGHTDLPDLDAPDISKAAIEGSCAVCKETLDLMLKFLGLVAGNLAMTMGAFGGVYIAGGIVNKLGEYFYESGFREAFEDKGRMRAAFLSSMATLVMKHPYPAFLGLQKNLKLEDKES